MPHIGNRKRRGGMARGRGGRTRRRGLAQSLAGQALASVAPAPDAYVPGAEHGPSTLDSTGFQSQGYFGQSSGGEPAAALNLNARLRQRLTGEDSPFQGQPEHAPPEVAGMESYFNLKRAARESLAARNADVYAGFGAESDFEQTQGENVDSVLSGSVSAQELRRRQRQGGRAPSWGMQGDTFGRQYPGLTPEEEFEAAERNRTPDQRAVDRTGMTHEQRLEEATANLEAKREARSLGSLLGPESGPGGPMASRYEEQVQRSLANRLMRRGEVPENATQFQQSRANEMARRQESRRRYFAGDGGAAPFTPPTSQTAQTDGGVSQRGGSTPTLTESREILNSYREGGSVDQFLGFLGVEHRTGESGGLWFDELALEEKLQDMFVSGQEIDEKSLELLEPWISARGGSDPEFFNTERSRFGAFGEPGTIRLLQGIAQGKSIDELRAIAMERSLPARQEQRRQQTRNIPSYDIPFGGF